MVPKMTILFIGKKSRISRTSIITDLSACNNRKRAFWSSYTSQNRHLIHWRPVLLILWLGRNLQLLLMPHRLWKNSFVTDELEGTQTATFTGM